jgi:ATP-dependent RNA helicase DeaD
VSSDRGAKDENIIMAHEPDEITRTTGAENTEQTEAESAEAQATAGEAETGAAAFARLGLTEHALKAVTELGYGTPTPVQEQTIPALLAGRDVIAQAPTGTGKTAAYGLPIVEHLDDERLQPQALIVVPTRELAIQVAEALHTFGKYREMVTLPIYGGQPYDRQLRALARGVQVVVGTPGRLLDHLQRGTLQLAAVRTVVLDEADEMLDMGFIEDIEAILAQLPEQRQSALFSATIPPRIARLAEQYLRDPENVRVAAREAVAPRVQQVYYEVPNTAKPEALSRILDLEEPESAIVFVRTRRDADEVAEQLSALGYLAQAIHGEVNQAQRERILDRFRAGRTQLLVATDVAARGLDIPDVSHIINYDLPVDAESYVHRIGRTGRAGRSGQALTLVTPREIRQFRFIEHAIHRRLQRLRLPTPADVAARRRAAFREEVLQILDAGQLDPFLRLVEDLSGTREPAELAAAAFKMAAQTREATRPGAINIWEAPAPAVEEVLPLEEEAPPTGRRERGGRREAGPAPRGRRERPAVAAHDMARLFLRVGRRDGVRPADVVGAIANETGLPGDAIGDIDIYDTFAFVDVPEEAAERVRIALNRTTIRGRQVKATLARPSGTWESHEARGRDGGRDERDLRRKPSMRDEGTFEERAPLRAPYGSRRTPRAGGKPGGPHALGRSGGKSLSRRKK